MMRTDFRTAIAALLILPVVFAGRAAAVEPSRSPAGILMLRNGSAVEGTFSELSSGEAIAWQAAEFTDPFEFLIEGVTAINFPPAKPRVLMEGEFALELHSGDLLSGRLLDWSEGVVTLESPQFGRQQIREQSIQRIERIDENPTLVFSGLTGLGDWDHVVGDWEVEGVELKTATPDASLMGDFDIPDRAVVEFQLSWKDTPNFSFAVGVDPNARLNTSRGWSFDTWNSQLTLVRERDDIAVVEPVLKLGTASKQVRLTVFIDRQKGTILIYRHDGSLPLKASLPPAEDEKAETNSTGIAFVSHFGETRLQRLRVSHWEGSLPIDRDTDISRFRLKNGQILTGKFKGFDRSSQTVTVERESEPVSFELGELVKAEFKDSPAASKLPMIVALQDQSRLSGTLLSIGEDSLRLASPDLLQPVEIDLSRIRSVALNNRGGPIPPLTSAVKSGRLELKSHTLRGHLVPAAATDRASCLAWQPDFSRTSSPLLRNAAGRVVYREKKPAPPARETTPRQQPRTVFGKFGQLFLQNAKQKRNDAAATGEPHDLHLISGDVLPCLVKSIDEQGLHIEGAAAEVDLIPHDKVKALVLMRTAKLPDLDEEKKTRLLTLPRNQKGSPPTHLLCSDTSDFLRCRLNHFDADSMRIEIHLAEMELPSHRISHIIWLHPEKLLKQGQSAANDLDKPLIAEKPGTAGQVELHEVQVLLTGDNRSTFTPREVTDERILGTSDVIGGCSYDMKNVDQIIFGSKIEAAALELPYHQWALTPALEPLYLTADSGGPSDDGLASAFVGKPAPDFRLKLLDGGNFALSEAKGKIIVLDFWATWCGPCMLTMPLMEKAMEQFPDDKVEMISVNLEERPEQVRDVLLRHQLSPKVALDIDGAVARKYQVDSIPQLFVIDKAGNVARVYIGGGQGVVDQFTTSLQELLEPPSSEAPSGS